MKEPKMEWINQAVNGDREVLTEIIESISDMVYNLSLRMLGSPHDAQDAAQDIYVKIITNLSAFQGKSKFSTWVYRLACNYLIDYKKSMFAQRPLSFEIYGADIENGHTPYDADLTGGVDTEILAEELKMSCTNVMLQCFDAETRMIYVLGTMFHVDSKICGEILEMTPEQYRQRLSRARKKMAEFMKEYCGLTASKKCDCKKRVCHAIRTHRLNPVELSYTAMNRQTSEKMEQYVQDMEKFDEASHLFASMPKYRSPERTRDFIQALVNSEQMSRVRTAEV